MFIELSADPRADPPTRSDERATLTGFLRWQRETLELKCSGLDAADLARRSAESSTLSLLGLVRHLADVERGWFRGVMAGQDLPPHFSSAPTPTPTSTAHCPAPRWWLRHGTPGAPRPRSPTSSSPRRPASTSPARSQTPGAG
jgi:Protein of unknown function (DUF664)